MRNALIGLFVVAALAGGTAHAQEGYYAPPNYYLVQPPQPFARSHFYLGVAPQAMVVLDQTGPRSFLDTGGGFDLYLGGRLNRWVGLELGWQPTFHNREVDAFGRPVGRIALQAVTLDMKIYFARGRVQPYFVGGAGAYLLGDNFDVFAAGPGFQVGGGLDIWLTRHLSLGVRAQYRGVDLVDYDPANDDTFISMLSAGVDLTVRF
jgi:opacity protein-like surface antigen